MSLMLRFFRRKKSSSAGDDVAPDRAAGSVSRCTCSIPADNPIYNANDDTLGRDGFARSLAHQVMSLDVNEGAVVGVLGPWGSGKTSFVNLVRRHLENSGVKVFDFNPWMFSGADQLVDAFFVEVSALRIPMNSAGDSSNVRPFVPIAFGRVFRLDSAACSDIVRPSIGAKRRRASSMYHSQLCHVKD